MAQLSQRLPWELAAPKWAASLNPLLAKPLLNGVLLKNIALEMNVPKAINHLLQRLPQGWILVDQDASANVWRAAEFNNLTLTLESSADVTISLWVF